MKNGVDTIHFGSMPNFKADYSDNLKPSYPISAYLQQVLEAHGAKSGQVLSLPPLMALARFFRTSHLEVHDAFQMLRRKGYDYNLVALDDPIHFWYTAACDES